MHVSHLNLRQLVSAFVIALCCGLSAQASENERAAENESAWSALKKPGTIILFRHATAPGGGDPAGYVLNDCKTQRNLDEVGRAQARRIGERFREQGCQGRSGTHLAMVPHARDRTVSFPRLTERRARV